MSFMLWCHWVSAAASLNLNIFRYSTMQIVIVVVVGPFLSAPIRLVCQMEENPIFLPSSSSFCALSLASSHFSHSHQPSISDLNGWFTFFQYQKKKVGTVLTRTAGRRASKAARNRYTIILKATDDDQREINQRVELARWQKFLSNSLRQIKKHRRVKNWLN